MDAFQIILLVLGVAVFVASFFLPGGKKEDTGNLKKEEKRIREALDEEMKNRLTQTSSKMDEIIEEKNSEVLERTERGLERISNEKMMAVNEYADTVLADINKNHADVVFLYSMLNDKQDELRGILGDIDKGSKDAKKRIKELEEEIQKFDEAKLSFEESKAALEEAEKRREEALAMEAEVKEQDEEAISPDVTELIEKFSKDMKSEKKTVLEEDLKKDEPKKEKTEEKKRTRKKNPKIPDISSLPGGNSNEMILKLYQEGKSNVAIAKELGLGVGEVKLVIDLFKQS